MSTIQRTNQISPAMERMYHQSRLVGEWKGKWSRDNQAVGFKVLNIRGGSAEVEYTHNGRTERGIGKVDGATISFGPVTIGTKDGKSAVLLFAAGGGKASAYLEKQAPSADQDRLIGSWGGYSSESGKNASFRVISMNGRDAEVSVTTDGITRKGTGIIYKNVIMFGQAQISTEDGKNGKVIYQVGNKSFIVPVTKYPPADSSSVLDKFV
jgi:hypothetical protein